MKPPFNCDFETGNLKDWKADGPAFDKQPVRGDTVHPRRNDMRSQHAGEYWIGTFEIAGDAPQGTLTSSAFKVTHPWASFLVAGGSHERTCVEIVRADTKKAVFRVSGDDSETLRPVVVDLRPHADAEIFLRLVDHESGGWGHVNFDDFAFWTARPSFPNERKRDDIPPPDVVKHAGLSPKDAAAAMTLPEGFKVTVFAAEPDITQPIAMALDDRGRLWVAEGHCYPQRRRDEDARDRILVFEDKDGDGAFDRRTVFIENLNLVSGLEVGFGGVWVGAAPHLLFIPDKDGDDVPDGKPEVVLDGWGFQDTHETLNAFIWGPDGWLYGCHGVFTHSLVGAPGTPKEKRVGINAGIWRYHPTQKRFELFGEGTSNPWGVDFNDHGHAFATACVIPHLYHIIQGGRFTRQAGGHFNPHTYADLPTIADHVHYAGTRGPHGGNNRSDAAGGGHAHCGAMIYLGDAWPKEYRGRIWMNNIHGNRLNMDVLEPSGSTYAGRHGPDFLLANDRWSRIVNLRYGPDGGAYVIDWYDKQPCHLTDVRAWDRGNGRIFKIAGREAKPLDLRKLTDEQLVDLQLHPNDWFVRHARRLLQERGAGEAARASLRKIVADNPDPTRKLRALWALHVTGGIDESLLAHENEHVRAWAVQLLCEDGKPRDLAKLAADPSPVVRLYVVSALQRLPPGSRWDALAALKADDRTLALMMWYAAEPLATVDASRALSLPTVFPFMVRRVAAAGSLDALAAVVDRDPRTVLQNLTLALRGQRKVDAPKGWDDATLLAHADPEVRFLAAALSMKFGRASAVPTLLEIAKDAKAPAPRRTACLDALVESKDASVPALLFALLSDRAMRERALRGLAAFDDPKTPSEILAVYGSLGPDEKRAALGTLASRAPYARELLAAVKEKRVPAKDLHADVVRTMRALGDEIAKQAEEVWGVVASTPEDKEKEIARIKRLVQAKRGSNLSAGRATFARLCMQCHTLFGQGADLGPDITGSNRADLDYILENIVNPNAIIQNEYRTTRVDTKDGRVIVGILTASNDKTVTVRDANQTHVVARADIKLYKEGGLSIMPEDQLKGFEDDEVRDLIAYLASPQQVPMLATPHTVGRFFNGKDLAGWDGDAVLWKVEDGEIVGKTAGLKQNAFLVSHLLAGDFRLVCEVKLMPDAANSGIQFRSAAHADGRVAGPQADIGKGWWGKLYEEEGRGTLWDRPGAAKAGDWNLYEIVAVGSKVRTAINGKMCVDLDDPKLARSGVIALQIHSGGATDVRFRKFALELAPAFELTTVRK